MTVRYLVLGAVQGVGFRWFVLKRAHALGLRGFVRNLADGRVEVVASGPAETLHSLERLLLEGPEGADVTGVEKSEILDEVYISKTFEIR